MSGNRRYSGGMASSMSNLHIMERDTAMKNATLAIHALRDLVEALERYTGGQAAALTLELDREVTNARALLRDSKGKIASLPWRYEE